MNTISYLKFLFKIFFILVMLQDVVNGIEFARGDPETAWGSSRAAMGHPEPFQLYYVSIGNQECSKYYYKGLQAILFSSCLAS